MYTTSSIAKRRQNYEYRNMQNMARNTKPPRKYKEPKAKPGALPIGHLLTDAGRKELEQIRREEVERMAARGGNHIRNRTHEQYTAPPDRPGPGVLQIEHASRDDAPEVFDHMKRQMEARNAARVDHALENRIHARNTPPPDRPGPGIHHMAHVSSDDAQEVFDDMKRQMEARDAAWADHALHHRIREQNTPPPNKLRMGHALTENGQAELLKIRMTQVKGGAGTSQFSGPHTGSRHAASSQKLVVCESCQAEMRNRDSSVQHPRPKSAVQHNMTSLMRRLSL
jgi:hypothetical protein